MTTVNVGTTKNTVTVNGETRVVTVKTGETRVVTVKVAGPQGPGFSDGNKGDVTIANDGASITINSGTIVDADINASANIASSKLADSGVTSGSYGSGSAIPTITVNDKGIVTGISTNSVNTTTNLSTTTSTTDVTIASSTGNNASISEASGSAAGVMSVAHHDKLDGIESNATADQTAAEIKTLLNSDGIVNAQVDASAAIDGSKISPNFGSQDITTTGDIKINSISKSLQVGDITNDNYAAIQQVNSSSIRGFTTEFDNASVFENLQGSTNQHIILGDVGADDGNTLFGVSITSGGIFTRLSLSGTGNLNVHNNITLGGTVDGVDIAARDTLFGALTSSSGVLTNGVTGTTQSATDDSTKIATTAFVKTAVSNLVDSAPDTLNTLNELAAALGDNPNFATTVTNSIGDKLPLSGGTLTGNLVINTIAPLIQFNESGTSKIYNLVLDNSNLSIRKDSNAGSNIVQKWNSDGHVDFLFNVDFASGIDVTGNLTVTTGALTITSTLPQINLTDSDNSDWYVANSNGTFRVRNTTNSVDGLMISSSGQVDFAGNVDCNSGLDVTGAITSTVSAADTEMLTFIANMGTNNNRPLRFRSPATDNANVPFTIETNNALEVQIDDNKTLNIDATGQINLHHAGANTPKLNTIANGVKVHGNIGIGTATPNRMLHIVSNGNSKIALTDSDITAETDSLVGGIDFTTTDTDNAGISAQIGAYHEDQSGNAYLRFNTGNASSAPERMRIKSDGAVELTETLKLQNNKNLNIGGSNNLVLKFDGSVGRIQADSQPLYIKGLDGSATQAGITMYKGNSSEKMFEAFNDGAVKLYFDGGTYGTPKLSTIASGAVVNGELDINSASYARTMYQASGTDTWSVGLRDSANGDTDYHIFRELGHSGEVQIGAKVNANGGLKVSNSIFIPDATITNGIPNNAIKIGDATNGDLMIYHDSNNSVIRDAGTGALIFQSNQIVGYRYGTAEKLFQFDGLGAASLFHGGASTAKLFTIATGVSVVGRIGIGTSNPARPLTIRASDCRLRLEDPDANNTNGASVELSNNAGNGYLNVNNDNSLNLQTDNTVRLSISGTGTVNVVNDLAVDTDTLFVDSTNDRVGINQASPSQALDVTGQIRVFSTTGGGTTSGLAVANSHDNFTMSFAGSNANSDFVMSYGGSGGVDFGISHEGAVKLNYGGSTTPKLETTANGITVDGRVRLDKGDQLDFGDQFRILKYTSSDTMTLQSPEDVVIVIDNNANGSTNHKFAILKETTNPDNGTGTELFKVEETGNTTIAGNVVATGDGTFDDIRVGEWSGATNYGGVFHKNHSGNEYMIISNGSSGSGDTYISATTGRSVIVRGGNNSQTNQIQVNPTGGINLTAANNVNILDGNIDFGSNADNNPVISMKGDNNRVKYRVFTSSDFGMGFSGNITHGGLNGHCVTFQVSNNSNRGWLFLNSGQSLDKGAMALTADGKMNVAHSLRLGYGESDTTASGATHVLDVSGDANITGTLETKALRFGDSHVKRISVDYTGEETGGDGSNYLNDNEFQEILTITPSGSSQNYSVIGRIIAASGANVHTIDINVALRSNTLPDLQVSGSYISTITGTTEFLTPRFWLKETTTAAFKLVVEINARIFGRVTADLEIIARGEADLNNIVVNEDETSEVTSIPTGYAQTTPTKVYETDDGAFSFDGNLTVGGNIDLSTSSSPQLIFSTASTRNKIQLYPSTSATYAIGFDNGMSFGGLNDYATTFQMNNDGDRGWIFLDNAHSDAQGAMALTTNGKMTLAHSLRLGYGESDTTTPATAYTAGSDHGHIGGSYSLDIKGKLKVDGDTLGTTAGDQVELAYFKSIPNQNRSHLSIFQQRDTDGTTWTSAYTRIQQFIDSTPMGYIQFNGTDNTNGMEFGRGPGGTKFIFCDFGGPVKLYHDGVERFSTDTTGANVLNGSLGTNDSIYMKIGRNEAANNTAIVGFKYSGTSGSNDNKAIIGVHGNRELLTVSANGIALAKNTTVTGTVTCTSLTETSDIAFKENIQPLSNVLDKVKQLTGYKYNFKDNEKLSMGVIAQDVEKVFPELVHGEEGKKSLQYSGLVGALIEAVKELSAKVAVLESK